VRRIAYIAAPMKTFILMVALAPALVFAQTFDFQKPTDDKKEPKWDVQAKAGLLAASGNSKSISFTVGGTAAHTWSSNRLLLEAGIAFARSQLLIANDGNGNGVIDPDEIERITQTTTKAASAKLRYDRFFGGADQNSAFLSARVASDPPAGKQIVGGTQLGYSRQIFKSERFETIGELGYDFTYEKDEDAPPAMTPGVSIHSLRAYLQESVRFPPQIGAALKFELLENLNSETAPNEDGTDTVGTFKDMRINAGATLNAALTSKVSLAFGFTVRYDAAPSLRPAFSLPYAPGFRPFADKLDTLTEASLVVTLL
jgi:putative salt-induced outer membrane protein YdiY